MQRANAVAWGKKRVLEIESGTDKRKKDQILLGGLLDKYLDDPHVKMGRSKRYSLKLVRDCEIAKVSLPQLKSTHIVDLCRDRSLAGAGPATVACDVSNLRSVLRNAEALYDIDIDETIIVRAMPTLYSLGLVGKPSIRTRRPNQEEIDLLKKGLIERESKQGSSIPFSDILDFSILSCMRVGEVCKILWEDLNEDEAWVWVRDRKDPRKKVGNHMKVPLLGGTLDIVLRQSRTEDPRIFPYNPRSVTAGFQRVRNALGIKDLRYHDLRREGASRLFEAGYKIDEVAQVTGHRNLNTLWRIYTDLSPNRLTD
ncbi:MAG: tyrosine-type recombinase/integrase [Alphaproteobacteria bacterium]|nr:tyrosine-type recombinase/integrase [Alphaproteobacteria bacterium]